MHCNVQPGPRLERRLLAKRPKALPCAPAERAEFSGADKAPFPTEHLEQTEISMPLQSYMLKSVPSFGLGSRKATSISERNTSAGTWLQWGGAQ